MNDEKETSRCALIRHESYGMRRIMRGSKAAPANGGAATFIHMREYGPRGRPL
jgi:hypothetical protein